MERKFGPYTLIRQIAVGGMAEIHLARTEGIAGFEKYVAIKMIHPNFSEDRDFVQMLIDEAKITVQLAHVNIAQTFDLGRVGKTYYITMEYVEGCDLYKLLREGSELDIDVPIDVAAYIIKEAATGLDYAHRKRDVMGMPLKIVHRDVSPQNVLVSLMGEVKVIDFGIAKATEIEQKTQAGVIKGKYYYMSPEQAWGEHLDSRTDIFSLGIILYELLTGQMLYMEENLQVLLERIREANIAPPTSLRRDIPPELEEIVMKTLSKRPTDRYESGAAMAAALEGFLRNYSPTCAANTVTEWTESVFGVAGDDIERSEVLDEDHLRAVTQGLQTEELLGSEDDFNDENSIIFRVSDIDKQISEAKAREQPSADRDINQETGVAAPNKVANDPFSSVDSADEYQRDISDATHAMAEGNAVLAGDQPFAGLYDEDEGEDKTMVSDMQSMMSRVHEPQGSSPPPEGRANAVHSQASPNLASEFDSAQTVEDQDRVALAGAPPGKPPGTAPSPLSEGDEDVTGTHRPAKERPGPWEKNNALNAANPKPAVSVLKPTRKSRRTPPQGVPTSDIQKVGSESLLADIIGSTTGRTRVALSSPSSDSSQFIAPLTGSMPLSPGPSQAPQPGIAPMPQPFAAPPTSAPAAQVGTPPHPGLPALHTQQPNAFAPSPGDGLSPYDIDELPDSFKLSGNKKGVKILLAVLAFAVLAAGVAAGAHFLLSSSSDNSQGALPATLMIVSSPDGAKVMINGSLLTSKTPATYSSAKLGDEVTIVVDLAGHKTWKRALTLDTPDNKIVARLEPIRVTLTVTSKPSGAYIYLKGKKVSAGRTPKKLLDLDPNDVSSITLKKAGYDDMSRKLDWSKDASKEENFLLVR